MKKNFFYGLIAAAAVMMFLMGGCKQPTDDNGGDPVVNVTSVSISKTGTGVVSGTTQNLFVNSDATLIANVMPADATDKSVVWTTSDANVVTVENGVVTGVGEGDADITVTTQGKKADGESATASVSFHVTVNPDDIVPELILVNQAATPGGTTTISLPALNADNRLVISNDEAVATVPGAAASVTGNTIVYLNKPLSFDSDNNEPFSISARVKITGVSAGVTSAYNDTGHGIIIGVFTDPAVPVSAETPLYFVGIRSAAGGQKRMYSTRNDPADNSASNINGPAGTFEEHDKTQDGGFNFNKLDGFADQEFIVKTEKTAADQYTLSIWTPDGLTQLATGTRGPADSQVSQPLKNPENPVPLYAGFIVYGVTAEISSIVIAEGGGEVFSLAKDAAPAPVAVKQVRVSTETAAGADETYDYQCPIADFPSGGVQLSALVYPQGAGSAVTWSITEGGALGSVSSAGLVAVTSAGAVTVRATVGEAFDDFKFNILAGVPAVTSVTVSGPDTVMAGDGIQTGRSITLSAAVEPSAAPDDVTWSVTADDGTSATTAATINAATGMLSAAGNLAADTVVKVFASSSHGAGNSTVKSPAYSVTVKKFSAAIWEWNVGDGFTSGQLLKGVGVFTTGGTITSGETGLSMGKGRWVLGNTVKGSDTSSSVYISEATLDLSQKFKITVEYIGATNAGNFFVYLNNNGTSSGNSVFGGSTGTAGKSGLLIVQANPSTAGTLTVTVDPATDLSLTAAAVTANVVKADVLQHSFLQFRCDSSLADFTITHILVENVD